MSNTHDFSKLFLKSCVLVLFNILYFSTEKSVNLKSNSKSIKNPSDLNSTRFIINENDSVLDNSKIEEQESVELLIKNVENDILDLNKNR